MQPKDSSNVLDDFDFCLALSQIGINSQLATAFKAWKLRKQFTGKVKIFKTKKDGVIKDAKSGLEAEMDPLKIDLNVADAKFGQVRVTIPLRAGTVTFFSEESGELEPFDFEDWEISFLTDLDRRPVDLDLLETIDPGAVAAAREAIHGLPESVFSIEFLFMKLQQVNLLLESNRNIRIPDNVPSAARDRALSALQFLLQGDLGDFPLGVVVRRKKESTPPTFALTDFVFNVHPQPAAPKASTLAYLGMLQGRPRPENINIARSKLASPWASPALFDGAAGSVSGVMVIRRNKFLDEHVMPRMTAALGEAPTGSALTRQFSETNSRTETTNLVTKVTQTSVTGYDLTVSVNRGTPELLLSGRVHSRSDVVEVTHGAELQTSSFRQAVEVPITGSLRFVGESAGISFGVKAELTLTLDENNLVETLREQDGSANFLDFVADIFGKPISEQIQDGIRHEAQRFSVNLRQELQNLSASLTETRFIPPGGGVFTFRDPHFSSETGDMVFNVIYQAP